MALKKSHKTNDNKKEQKYFIKDKNYIEHSLTFNYKTLLNLFALEAIRNPQKVYKTLSGILSEREKIFFPTSKRGGLKLGFRRLVSVEHYQSLMKMLVAIEEENLVDIQQHAKESNLPVWYMLVILRTSDSSFIKKSVKRLWRDLLQVMTGYMERYLYHAQKYYGKKIEDLYQESWIGLEQAVAHYFPAISGAHISSFKTLARWYIHGYTHKSYKRDVNLISVPEQYWDVYWKKEGIEEDLSPNHEKIIAIVETTKTVSMDTPPPFSNEETLKLHEIISSFSDEEELLELYNFLETVLFKEEIAVLVKEGLLDILPSLAPCSLN